MNLVIGGTGRLGRRVVRSLLSGGDEVRALARSDEAAASLTAAGVGETARGDLDDASTLRSAFVGVDRVFLVTPFSARQEAQEKAAIQAAAEAGVELVVNVSTEAIRLAEGLPDPPVVARVHRAVEDEAATVGVPFAALRPTFVLHLLDGLRAAIAAGEIALPAGDARIAFVHPQDVADVAVSLLRAEKVHEGPLHLTGPEALTFYDVADRLVSEAGEPVRYRPVEPEEWVARLVAAGVGEDFARGQTSGFTLYDQHGDGRVFDDVERLLGRPPRDLDAYLRDDLQLGQGAA